MHARAEHLRKLIRGAKAALESFEDDLVFAGSDVMGLYVLRPAGPALRTTKDVDCITTVPGAQHAIKLGKLVMACTLTPERDVLCRYRSSTGDFIVDVLDLSGTTTGGNNRWFGPAVDQAGWWDAGGGIRVRAITPPYFVLTKLVSLQDGRRTEGHALYHHDLIDIVTVLTEVADFQVMALPLLADLRREVETLCGIAKDLEPDLIVDACHAEASVKPLLEWLGF